MNESGHIYGLDNWIFMPPFSAIFGLLLLFGCDKVGSIFLNYFGISTERNSFVIRMQAIPVGVLLISIVIYPLAVAQITSLFIMQAIGSILLVLGLYNFMLLVKYFKDFYESHEISNQIKFQNSDFYIVLAILFFLFLLALSPVTSNDSLDYHIGYAISLLNHGGMLFIPEWFLGRYSAHGEVMNALGLAIGSEQFGSLIQWGGLIALVSMIWPMHDNSKRKIETLLILAAVSAPVLLFLVSSQKPQLWPISMTSFAFYLYLITAKEKILIEHLNKRFALVCMLCMCASQVKFNYILGGSIAISLMFYLMVINKQVKSAILILFSSAFFILLPPLLWKLSILDTSVFEIFTNPLPGDLPGTAEALKHWRNETDHYTNLPFPISIIFPDSIGAISSILGIGWILLIFFILKLNRENNVALISIFVLIIVTSIFAPPAARMFLEPYYWMLIFCSYYLIEKKVYIKKFFHWIIRGQALLFLAMVIYGVYILFPAALSNDLRKEVLMKTANGYDLMQWVNKELPEDAILINAHRSSAIVPRKSFNNFIWTNYVDINSKDAYIYLNRMKDIKPTHIMVLNEISHNTTLLNCLGSLHAGPKETYIASRNPWNSGLKYNAWLFEIDYKNLPVCAKKI